MRKLALVLIGVGMNALLIAGINWMLTRATLLDAQRAQLWLNGSLNNADRSRYIPAAFALAASADPTATAPPMTTVLRAARRQTPRMAQAG